MEHFFFLSIFTLLNLSDLSSSINSLLGPKYNRNIHCFKKTFVIHSLQWNMCFHTAPLINVSTFFQVFTPLALSVFSSFALIQLCWFWKIKVLFTLHLYVLSMENWNNSWETVFCFLANTAQENLWSSSWKTVVLVLGPIWHLLAIFLGSNSEASDYSTTTDTNLVSFYLSFSTPFVCGNQ